MTLSFPRTMPTDQFASSTRFRLGFVTARNRLRSTASFSRRISPPGWLATLTTAPLDLVGLGKWQGFFDSLDGGVQACLLFNPRRRQPANYIGSDITDLTRAGGGAFDGAGVLSGYTNAFTINVNTLPASFVVKAGDMVGLVKSSRYSLHRAQEDATANGSGVITGLNLRPDVSDYYNDTGVSVNFLQPLGEFLVDFDSIQGDEDSVAPHPLTFSAVSRAF